MLGSLAPLIAMRMLPLLLLRSLFSVFSACDAQVDADYMGTPLVQLSGEIRNHRTMRTGDAEVVVVWEVTHVALPGTDVGSKAPVAVDNMFRASFTLSIFELPTRFDSPVVGYTVVETAGSNVETLRSNGTLGMDIEHLLIYLPYGVPPGSDISYLLHGTPPAGFHLYRVHHITSDDAATRGACLDAFGPTPTLEQIYVLCGGSPFFDDLLPLDDDLATPIEIELVDDPSAIDLPHPSAIDLPHWR